MAQIGYARVSTGEQNLDLQVDALTKAGCERIFQDRLSGTKDDRPGLAAAIAVLKPGDSLSVWRLDRLGRSVAHLITTINDFRARGIDFRSLTESIDTTSPSGKLTFVILCALSEFERDLVRTRTLAGLEAARARGRLGGRPTKMSDEKVDAALSLLDHQKLSVDQVCGMLNIGRSTLYRALRERKNRCDHAR